MNHRPECGRAHTGFGAPCNTNAKTLTINEEDFRRLVRHARLAQALFRQRSLGFGAGNSDAVSAANLARALEPFGGVSA